jgi:hypothetical protein
MTSWKTRTDVRVVAAASAVLVAALAATGIAASNRTGAGVRTSISFCFNPTNGAARIVAPSLPCRPGERRATLTPPRGEAGPQGAAGPQGPAGAVGPKGEPGAAGPVGPKGDTGAQGPQGDAGDPGGPGEQGPQGPKGDKGDKGDTGETGAQGPEGPSIGRSAVVFTATFADGGTATLQCPGEQPTAIGGGGWSSNSEAALAYSGPIDPEGRTPADANPATGWRVSVLDTKAEVTVSVICSA